MPKFIGYMSSAVLLTDMAHMSPRAYMSVSSTAHANTEGVSIKVYISSSIAWLNQYKYFFGINWMC